MRHRLAFAVAGFALAWGLTQGPGQPIDKPRGSVRFAAFNASLNRDRAGGLVADLSTADNAQARNVVEVIQRVRPDVLLVNEFDHDDEGRAAELFRKNDRGVGQNGAAPIEYHHRFSAEVTVVGSGVFWPAEAEPLGRLVRTRPEVATSGHQLVVLDVRRP